MKTRKFKVIEIILLLILQIIGSAALGLFTGYVMAEYDPEPVFILAMFGLLVWFALFNQESYHELREFQERLYK